MQEKGFEVKSSIKSRKYDIKEDGKVEMVETVENVVVMTPQQFKGFYMQHTEGMFKVKQLIDGVNMKDWKKDFKNLKEQSSFIKPVLDECEKVTQENYARLRFDGTVKNIKESVVRKDCNLERVNAVINSLPDDRKDELMKRLNNKEKKALASLMLKAKKRKR